MHNMAFKKLDFDGCYGRYHLENGEELRDKFIELGLKGANITVPHKEYAYKACDVLDPFARKVKAVNTIMKIDGILHGYNTDAPGFLRTIEPFGSSLDILLLGAGGTAQAASAILRDAGHNLTILNRSKERLRYFSENGLKAYTWEEFPAKKYDLIVNMTSAGLADDNLPLPSNMLEPLMDNVRACIDVIYGKRTPFLELAISCGKPALDGSNMLLYQGVIAFDIFTEGKYSQEEIEYAMKPAFDL